jgi:hypothetical protein
MGMIFLVRNMQTGKLLSSIGPPRLYADNPSGAIRYATKELAQVDVSDGEKVVGLAGDVQLYGVS